MDLDSRLAAHYPAHLDRLIQVHRNALDRSGHERVAIHSGTPKICFLDDSHYPFKANPLFKAWAPLTRLPFSWIILGGSEKPQMLYYQPDDYWHTRPENPSGFWAEEFDITVLGSPEQARDLIGPDLSSTAFLGEETVLANDWGFGAINPAPLLRILHFSRAVKSEYEIECLRQASRMGAAAHQVAERQFRAGASEYAIHQAYLASGQLTDDDLPYSNIVALNENGAVLHYDRLERQAPAEIRSFLIDAGAQFSGYASDITRTYSSADDEFAELVDQMDQAQLRLVDGMRADVDYRDLHLAAHREVAGQLHRFGIVEMTPDAMIETGVTSTFLPHGLGHLIGLQVHDVGGFMADDEGNTRQRPDGHPFLRLTRTLQPGFAVTVEPGLYFIDPLLKKLKDSDQGRNVNWQRVDQFRPFGGIRIEDDICVRPEGPPENLTRDAFAMLEPH